MEKKKKLGIGILLFIGLFVAIGLSYAYWTQVLEQTDKNRLESGCFLLEFQGENDIELLDAYPITNETAESLTPYSFTITNKCDGNATFSINLETLNTTTFEDLDYIRMSLNEKESVILSEQPVQPKTLDDALNSHQLKTGYLEGNASKTYTLKMWLDENTPMEEKYMSKIFESKVVVVANTYSGEIDKTPPVASFTTTPVNGGYLVDARASSDVGSSIMRYYFSKDGENWVSSTEDNYVFKDETNIPTGLATEVLRNLEKSEIGDVYVKVEDEFENISEVVKKTVKVKEIYYDGTEDNNLRYAGSAPKNYVTFNNELWRIIGVMNRISDSEGKIEDHVKIMKDSVYKRISYDNALNDLNGTYYNTLNEDKKMISNIIWKTGKLTTNVLNVFQFYTQERSEQLINDQQARFTGKIGMMYPSDFGFASNGGKTYDRKTCLNTNLNLWTTDAVQCYQKDWLHKGEEYWLLSYSDGNSFQFIASSLGYVANANMNSWKVDNVFPALYLKSNVKIIDGDGSSNNPFQLSIEE